MNYIDGGADFSVCGRYRLRLWRTWRRGPYVSFTMLNPSKAGGRDAAGKLVDDPTVRKCVGFAYRLGFAGLVVTNLFALVSTSPRGLLSEVNPIGPAAPFVEVATNAGVVIAAWGRPPSNAPVFRARIAQVLRLLTDKADVHALSVTKDGHPGHPLMLPYSLKPAVFRPRTAS